MKERAILAGPFVGELCWEFFRFAPHAIYLKKNSRRTKLIVLTRQSRFDLYGNYADTFVPLRLKYDADLERDCFKLIGFAQENYYSIAKYFKEKFKKKYDVVKHIYPDVRLWRYKVRWQFPRNKMVYDFHPREKNIDIAKRSMGNYNSILDCLSTNKRTTHDGVMESGDLFCRITNFVDDIHSSTLGSIIESIKQCDYVIGNVKYEISHLALLLGVPLIHVEEAVANDFLKLINPLNTPVIFSDNIEKGIEYYENNLRS